MQWLEGVDIKDKELESSIQIGHQREATKHHRVVPGDRGGEEGQNRNSSIEIEWAAGGSLQIWLHPN